MARGSVNHPPLALWLCGWRGAGRGRKHPGTGSSRSPLCSPSLGFPAHASPAETNPASVTAIPARGPLVCHYHQPSSSSFSSIHSLFYRFTSPVPPAVWVTMEGTSVRATAISLFVLSSFKDRAVLLKIWLPGFSGAFFTRLSLYVSVVGGREGRGSSLALCVWQRQGCAWPCSWDDVRSSLLWLNSHIVSAWDCWWEGYLHWVHVSVGILTCVRCCPPYVSYIH